MRIDRTTRTDRVLAEIARRLTEYRLNRNESLAVVAANAGLSEKTVFSAMSNGRMTVATLIRLLRALDQLDNLNAFLPAAGPDPLELARAAGKSRQRAGKQRGPT